MKTPQPAVRTSIALADLASVDLIEAAKPRADRERIHPVTIALALVIVAYWLIAGD